MCTAAELTCRNFGKHAIRADLDGSEAEVLSEMKSSGELIGFKQIELGSWE